MPERSASLVEEIISAHGGKEVWDSIELIEVDHSADGFLFTAKHRPPLKHVTIRAVTDEPHLWFLNFPRTGESSELIGNEEVRICRADGSIIDSRPQPRSYFKGIRRNLLWDAMDFTYFAGYANWNYLTTPFIFLRPGFSFEFLGRQETSEGIFSCLRVTFPDDLPTHCKIQTFYFDDDRLLRRLDYTAEVVGGWAHAAHFCYDYKEFSGIRLPMRRRVTPTMLDKPMKFPMLVAIDIHDVRIKFR